MSEEIKKAPKPGRVHAFLFSGPASVEHTIRKAETSTQLRRGEIGAATQWLYPPYDQDGLERLVDDSTVLLQCIDAYASNIVGFGVDFRYREDIENAGEEQEAELRTARAKLRSLCIDTDITQLFEHIVTARETFGTAYLEVMRDIDGNVKQIEFVEDTATIQKARREDTAIEVTVLRAGEPVTYDKRFSKYRQQASGKTVYYREFGDPRIMDNRTGEFVDPKERALLPKDQANEILEFPLGSKPYGRVRWRGNILGIDGAHRAEGLNNNYFVNGRHTPLLIMIKGGMLDPESEETLQDYMDGIRGENGQHKFIVLCAEPTGENTFEEGAQKPDIEIVPLANILQHDELFGEYIDNKRKQIQSAFRLPDLYVGYTTDFNRATAQTAQEVTEQQVFQKERAALAWIINNKLLSGFGYKYVEAYFLEPDITNPDDLHKLMTVCNNAGGLTPNKAKEVLYGKLGEQAEPYTEDWGEVPLAISQSQTQATQAAANLAGHPGTQPFGGLDFDALGLEIGKQVRKAAAARENPELIKVLKSIQETFEEIAAEGGTA